MATIYVLSLVLLFIIRLRFPSSKSIAGIITNRYGSPVLKLIRKYEKADFRSRKLSLDTEFLNHCIKNELIPTFVKFKVANHRLKNSKAYKDCQLKLLRQELHGKKNALHSVNKRIEHLKAEIRTRVNIIDFAHISGLFLARNDKILNKVRLTQEKKLYNLGFREAQNTNDPEKVIFNFSTRTLTPSEKKLLAKGLNLSIPPKKLNYGDILTPFELLFRDILKSEQNVDNSVLDPVASSIKNEAYKCFNSYNPNNEQNLPPNEVEALKSLMKDESIVIHKSDKGNSVVLLNKDDYVTRMKELLNDVTKFRKLNIKPDKEFNYVHNQELRITNILNALHKKGALSDSDMKGINPKGSRPGILYGLSKIHKATIAGIPKLRPILSAIKTPTYNLSKFLVDILEPYTTNQFTAKDSFSFANDVRSQDPNLFMSSLDVDALFTNIPLDETINICVNLVFKDQDIAHNLNKEEFRSLLKLATRESFILFNGNYYQQIDGVAMGSPLGPSLANIFLCYHEQNWLADCPTSFKPIYYQRYVDDIFILFRDPLQVEQFKTYMNSQHQNMSFTSETEINNMLPFLDVKVIRDNKSFITSVYRKPTFSGVYTNYDSFIPEIYKSSLIYTLLFRSYTLCSSWSLIDVEIKKLKGIMEKNSYPSHFIDRIIKRFLYRFYRKKEQQVSSNKKKQIQIILPFLGSTTRNLQHNMNKTIKKYIPHLHVKIISRAATRLGSLFRFKDRVPSSLMSGAIYKFQCGNCNVTYIGKTKRHTKKRFSEHMGISPLTGKPVKGQCTTAIRDHMRQCRCSISNNDFTILGRDTTNDFHLKIKESLFIHLHKPGLNGQKRSIPLALFKD